jgi:formiminotetrahydrofolate cyclodeaminase
MDDYSKYGCDDFVTRLASKSPVPGGGGASALVGAIGIALGNMVGSLTVGKPKYADVQSQIMLLKANADKLQAQLLNLINQDAEVFEPLSAAYGLPATTAAEQAEKAKVLEPCLKQCAAVPLQIMQCCAEAIDLHQGFASCGTAIAISDVGVGVAACKAALLGAGLNVFINTKLMQDRTTAEQINQQARQLLEQYSAKADAIYADVLGRLQ